MKCSKCGKLADKSVQAVWKCTSCGMGHKIGLDKVTQLQEKKKTGGSAILKCKNCSAALDDGNEQIYWKCECGNTNVGKLAEFGEEEKSAEDIINDNLIECPDCGKKVSEKIDVCQYCGFDLAMYKQAYERIYTEKLRELDKKESSKVEEARIQPQIIYKTVPSPTEGVHKPRCPYCNSENLTKITSLDKAVNIALFGIFGNKRKYQWHCNNCKTNW